MRVEPAHIDQIRRARDGRMVAISADAGGVAEDLARIDPGLKVRFAENGRPPFWAVLWESEDQRHTELVLTATAHRNHAGVWEGLDQRIVRRIEQIDPRGRGGYDYAAELERANRQAEDAKVARRRSELDQIGERAAFAVRKDIGSKLRITKSRDLPPAA